jgi:toxin ParE1/3/4
VRPATLSPAAHRDIEGAIRWIAKDNPAAARALRSGVARAATTIGEHRHIGTLRPDIVSAPYRLPALTGFPYGIMRVLHGARDLPEVARTL